MSKKIRTQKKRRVCRVSGCKHILSIYNPEGYCYVHQQIALTRDICSAVSAGAVANT